jgi:hypothetical protein
MKFNYDIFISYSNKDNEWVLELNKALERKNIRTWLDKFEIENRPIEDIENGLKNSKVIAIVVSPDSMASSWVKEELQIAKNLELEKEAETILVPLLLHVAEMPEILKTRQYIDFRKKEEFNEGIERLAKKVKRDSSKKKTNSISEDLSLHEIMLRANNSLMIWGHTLSKFAEDIEVIQALSQLIIKNVSITLILTNPYSSYEKAHKQFPHGGKHGKLAHEEIISTINHLKRIFYTDLQPKNFEVILTNFMPRFRTILIDNKICSIRLYMYGKDVQDAPELVYDKTKGGNSLKMFNAIQDSIDELIKSRHITYLIKDGSFNENWSNSWVFDILNHCIDKECCKNRDNCWNKVKNIILGYQNNDRNYADKLKLINDSYLPGTFTIDEMRYDAKFLEDPKDFDAWFKEALEAEIDLIRANYPNLFDSGISASQDIIPKIKVALEMCPDSSHPLKKEVWYQEYPDIFRRLIISSIVGDPDYNLDVYPHLTWERKDFIFKVINFLLETKDLNLNNWLHLSIASGLLGIDEKPVHAATSKIDTSMAIKLPSSESYTKSDIERVAKRLIEVANSTCRIDASNKFFKAIDKSKFRNYNIISFPDDYMETIFLLKYYENLLIEYPKLIINFVPRSIKCGNDATFKDVQDFIEVFRYLKDEPRFNLIKDGPKIGGLNIRKLSQNVQDTISRSELIDVRGARNYEMMQGINKDAYFGFMVCREISEAVVGYQSKELPFIYICQPSGERSFDGFKDRDIPKGLKFAKTKVIDNLIKWT